MLLLKLYLILLMCSDPKKAWTTIKEIRQECRRAIKGILTPDKQLCYHQKIHIPQAALLTAQKYVMSFDCTLTADKYSLSVWECYGSIDVYIYSRSSENVMTRSPEDLLKQSLRECYIHSDKVNCIVRQAKSGVEHCINNTDRIFKPTHIRIPLDVSLVVQEYLNHFRCHLQLCEDQKVDSRDTYICYAIYPNWTI